MLVATQKWGNMYTAKVVGADADLDVALLKLTTTNDNFMYLALLDTWRLLLYLYLGYGCSIYFSFLYWSYDQGNTN